MAWRTKVRRRKTSEMMRRAGVSLVEITARSSESSAAPARAHTRATSRSSPASVTTSSRQ